MAALSSAGCNEEIREYHHKGALPDLLRRIVHGRQQGRAAERLEAGQRIQHQREMHGPAPRRDLDGAVGHAPEADGISLLRGQVAERAGQLARVVEARGSGRPEIHGAARVEQ